MSDLLLSEILNFCFPLCKGISMDDLSFQRILAKKAESTSSVFAVKNREPERGNYECKRSAEKCKI
jgi:hypothetical protein